MRKSPEQDLQRVVAAYLDVALPSDAVWTAINPIPAKSKAAAGISKAMGLKAGILDILIIWRGCPYMIELKAWGGKISWAQADMIKSLSNAGAKCAICYNLEGVIGFLIEWGFPLRARAA